MGGPTEVLLAGTRFVEKGYQSFWGPGRHQFGSNWFWYFNSPLGCHVEYDADMDLHDERWTAREAPMGADASQVFLFQYREKWAPSAARRPGAAASLNSRPDEQPCSATSTSCPTAARAASTPARSGQDTLLARAPGRALSSPTPTPARTTARRWPGARTPT